MLSSIAMALYGRLGSEDGTPINKYLRAAALLELLNHAIEWIQKLGRDNFAKLVYDFATEGAWLCLQGVCVVAQVLQRVIVVYAPSELAREQPLQWHASSGTCLPRLVFKRDTPERPRPLFITWTPEMNHANALARVDDGPPPWYELPLPPIASRNPAQPPPCTSPLNRSGTSRRKYAPNVGAWED